VIHQITDPTDGRVKPFAGMRDAQLRGDEGVGPGLFIGESANVINRALDSGVKPHSLFMEQKWVAKSQGLIERFENLGAPVLVADPAVFKAITGYDVTRGAVACLYRPQLPSVDEVLAGATRIAVLEDVMNATNIGAAFRSAAALGIDAVLLTPSCHDPFYRRAARVSMGTIFQVPWTRIGESVHDWPDAGLERLHACGFKTAAMALSDNSVSIKDEAVNAEEKLAIVLGTEGDGLSPRTIAQCDYTVRIPMRHGVDSLNVAAASAVAFYQLVG
jgi:tRNA G18 (ribose-2'-O)-methylase SpoU